MSDVIQDQLIHELGSLHRGRGIRRPRIAQSVGPHLREALGLTPDRPDAEATRQLYGGLQDASKSLPSDLATVFRLAAAISSDEPTLTQRLALAVGHLDRGERTVQRRLHAANAMVASVLVERIQRDRADRDHLAPGGWHVESMSSTLDLGLSCPEFTGQRTIVAGHRLSLLTDAFSIPWNGLGAEPEPVELEAVDGCSVASFERRSASSWRYQLQLPRTLNAGERHQYTIAVRVPTRTFIKPYSVMVPLRHCRHFDTTIHFDPSRPACAVWRIDGLPVAALEDVDSGVELSRQETATTIRASFTELTSGLAYGLRWQEAPTAEV